MRMFWKSRTPHTIEFLDSEYTVRIHAMVQQLKEKFKEYTWMHNGSTTPTTMTNTSKNSMSSPVERSPITKEKGRDTVTKRKEPDSSFSSLNINKGSNTHIVYVRRKNISHVSDSSSSIKSVDATKEEAPPKVHVEKTQLCNNVDAHAPEKNGEISHNHGIRCTEPKNPEIPKKLVTDVLKVHVEKEEDCNKKFTHLHEKNNDVSNENSINCTEPKNPEFQNKIETEVFKAPLEKSEDCNEKFSCLHERNNEMSHDNIEPNNDQNPINLECSDATFCTHKKNSDISPVHTIQVGEAYNPLKPGNVELTASVDRSIISNINDDFKKTSNDSDLNYPLRSVSLKSQVEVKKSSVYQNREERYLNLQTLLNKCDQSGQEGYTTMLRSLTAAERSRYALELEKRALQLLLKEGKELSRMQLLNVFGQPSPREHSSPSIQFEPNYSQMSPYLSNKQ